jgi:hypothetical protein
MVNIERLDAVLARIDAHPEGWDQSEWRCGTGKCIAGHGVDVAGATWVTAPDGTLQVELSEAGRNAVGWWNLLSTESVYDPTFQGVDDYIGFIPELRALGFVHVSSWTREWLGLTKAQASVLFSPDNTREDLQRLRDVLAEFPDSTLYAVGVDPRFATAEVE